ncbi:hypothetical protein [Saccharopolyspora sp. NPDC049426]
MREDYPARLPMNIPSLAAGALRASPPPPPPVGLVMVTSAFPL